VKYGQFVLFLEYTIAIENTFKKMVRSKSTDFLSVFDKRQDVRPPRSALPSQWAAWASDPPAFLSQPPHIRHFILIMDIYWPPPSIIPKELSAALFTVHHRSLTTSRGCTPEIRKKTELKIHFLHPPQFAR